MKDHHERYRMFGSRWERAITNETAELTERIEALENQGHVLFLGSNTLKRIEALEEEMKEERERVWYDIGKIKQRLDIAMQLIRDEAKQAKHVENRVEKLEKAIRHIYPMFAAQSTPEPDSEPEPCPDCAEFPEYCDCEEPERGNERCPACHGIPATNHIHSEPGKLMKLRNKKGGRP